MTNKMEKGDVLLILSWYGLVLREQKLMLENLKVVWVKFSTLSEIVLWLCLYSMEHTHTCQSLELKNGQRLCPLNLFLTCLMGIKSSL
jgi:hypothetical protein